MTTTLQATAEKFTADPSAGRIAPKVTATLVEGQARVAAGPCDANTVTVTFSGP